eukprot:15460215-Alexandrium_andersonii.AAC.1
MSVTKQDSGPARGKQIGSRGQTAAGGGQWPTAPAGQVALRAVPGGTQRAASAERARAGRSPAQP